jgi:hypothetical protein
MDQKNKITIDPVWLNDPIYGEQALKEAQEVLAERYKKLQSIVPPPVLNPEFGKEALKDLEHVQTHHKQ